MASSCSKHRQRGAGISGRHQEASLSLHLPLVRRSSATMSNAPTTAQTQPEGSSPQSSHHHGLAQTTSMDFTASDASTALPPFPPAGASPDTRSPQPAHPYAEDLLNAAAQHVFPENPAPPRSPGDEKKGVTKEGRISPGDRDGSKRAKEGKQREEEPLLGGTPLDEMTPLKTPGILSGGTAGFPFPPKRTMSSSTITPANREGSGDTLSATARSGTFGAIPENEQLKTDLPQDMGRDSQPRSAVPARRPDLRAHDYGSVGPCSLVFRKPGASLSDELTYLFHFCCISTLHHLIDLPGLYLSPRLAIH